MKTALEFTKKIMISAEAVPVLVVFVVLGMACMAVFLHLVGDGAGNLVNFVQAKMK